MKLTWTSPGGTSVEFSKDEVTYKLLKNYDGFATSDLTYRTTSAPYQQGSTLLSTQFNPRKLTFSVLVTAPTLTDVQQATLALIRLFNPLAGDGTLAFEYEDGTVYYLSCSGRATTSTTQRGIEYQVVNFQMTAHDPFWYTSYQAASLGTSNVATFPLVFPFTLPSNTANSLVHNNGDVDAPATIIITGDVTNPKITNSTTGDFFEFTIDMDASDVMTITTRFGNKVITYFDYSAGTTVNGFQYLNADSVFWELIPGDNSLVFTSDAVDAATRVTLSWRDRYSGV
jgi:hypothetical protein